ncbi:hypothetical protein CI088_00420 [Enterococcus plantarum]|uniref:30S ribosomal protein S9 n=1 Tax=Enterococcus plantarum TaxID=1077675 RepID=A0A2W3ZNR9_9ENTE|nr:hypothetical protein CI088_00420 [Enterococcus plantarum]
MYLNFIFFVLGYFGLMSGRIESKNFIINIRKMFWFEVVCIVDIEERKKPGLKKARKASQFSKR